MPQPHDQDGTKLAELINLSKEVFTRLVQRSFHQPSSPLCCEQRRLIGNTLTHGPGTPVCIISIKKSLLGYHGAFNKIWIKSVWVDNCMRHECNLNMNENELISKLIPSRCHFPIQDIFSILHNTILRCRLFFLSILLKSWTKYPSDVNNISLCNPSSSWDPNIILITPISCSPPHKTLALLYIWTKPCQNN